MTKFIFKHFVFIGFQRKKPAFRAKFLPKHGGL